MARGPFLLVCVYLAVSLSLGSVFMTDLRESRPIVAKNWKGEEDIWSNCAKEGDPLKIVSVTLSPDPPTRGQTVVAKVDYYLKEEVTNGTISVFVKYGVIPYYSDSVNLCKTLNLNCPVKAGPGTVTVKDTIREFQPRGLYTWHANVTDQVGRQLACFTVKIQIS